MWLVRIRTLKLWARSLINSGQNFSMGGQVTVMSFRLPVTQITQLIKLLKFEPTQRHQLKGKNVHFDTQSEMTTCQLSGKSVQVVKCTGSYAAPFTI